MRLSRLIILVSVVLLSACAHGPIEGVKSFLGVSTRSLEDARATGVSEIFNADYDTCYQTILELMPELPARIYMQNKTKGMIVALGFRSTNFNVNPGEEILNDPLNEKIDTTELGIFLTKIDTNSTKVEFSSLSASLLEFASEKISKNLKAKLNITKESHE